MDTSERFTTTALPHISPSTHIIGLCGVGEYADVRGVYVSDPTLDGWMLSDFYLLHHLFRGLGSTQAWFTCIDPEVLVTRCGEYAHGNMYRERKVVLNQNQMPDPLTMRIEKPENLLRNALEHIRKTCQIAVQAEDPVLLCILCHGEEETFNLEIGGCSAEDPPMLKSTDIWTILQANEGVKVCLLMTFCFSGGWTITPNLGSTGDAFMATVMTAAGPNQLSESLPQSNSIGRFCGSLYISAVVNALENANRESEGEEESEMTTEALSAALTHQLLHVIDPRFGSVHDHRFEVQNVRWEEPYSSTTGFLLCSYTDKFAELRDVPPRPLIHAGMDRSNTPRDLLAWQEAHPQSHIGSLAATRTGGNTNAIKTMIQKQARSYIKSYPGRDSLAFNHGPHGLINDCISKPDTLSEDAWEQTWRILHYRINIMMAAQRIVKKMGLHFPAPRMIDMDDWSLGEGAGLRTLTAEYHRLALKYKLIPPMSGTRRRYEKAIRYVGAACASSGLPKEEMETRLKGTQSSM